MDIVEAAHIWPYRGRDDNHPDNGLLLRADLHTLFDLDLMGIEPDSLETRLHPTAGNAGYREFDGVQLCNCTSPAGPARPATPSRNAGSRFRNDSDQADTVQPGPSPCSLPPKARACRSYRPFAATGSNRCSRTRALESPV